MFVTFKGGVLCNFDFDTKRKSDVASATLRDRLKLRVPIFRAYIHCTRGIVTVALPRAKQQGGRVKAENWRRLA